MAEPSAATTPERAPSEPTVQPPPGMVLVPAGPFAFGRRKEQVALDAFWIDVHPVTNREYERFVEEHDRPSPRHWPPDGLTPALLDVPVTFLTYAEAEDFARRSGKALPTPAQFEKAARGVDGRKYPWGNEVRGRTTNTRESGFGRLTPVTAFAAGASPYGCLDMAGNVLHWTRGVYDPARGSRVLKGCSYRDFLGASAWAYEGEPAKRQDCVGFRCVWTPAGVG